MKKLFALVAAGALLALTTGCPPAPSTVQIPVKVVKPEPKPEPKPEVKPEPKPEVKPEVKPDLPPEIKPEPKPEVKPEPKPEPKPEVKPEPKPEVKPEPKPADTKTMTGKVMKIDKDKLTVDGKDVMVPADAKVMIDGKDDKLENVKADNTVTVTMDKDGKVTKVEAKK